MKDVVCKEFLPALIRQSQVWNQMRNLLALSARVDGMRLITLMMEAKFESNIPFNLIHPQSRAYPLEMDTDLVKPRSLIVTVCQSF